MSERTLLTIGVAAALGIVAGASTLAVAQFNPWNNNNVNMRSLTDNWSAPNAVGQLASNEGIYVDVKEFKINKGVAQERSAGTNREIRRKRGIRWRDHLPLR